MFENKVKVYCVFMIIYYIIIYIITPLIGIFERKTRDDTYISLGILSLFPIIVPVAYYMSHKNQGDNQTNSKLYINLLILSVLAYSILSSFAYLIIHAKQTHEKINIQPNNDQNNFDIVNSKINKNSKLSMITFLNIITTILTCIIVYIHFQNIDIEKLKRE